MPAGTSRLVAAQWAGATRLRAVIDAVAGRADTELDAAAAQIEQMLTVAQAEGVWLDRLGARLGLPRPTTDRPTDYFGFQGAGVGFDLAPFRDDAINRPREPIGDALYRALLRARGQALRGRGTAADVQAAARWIDREATVEDTDDMTATLRTRDTTAMQLALDSGALGLPAGVGLRIAAVGVADPAPEPDAPSASLNAVLPSRVSIAYGSSYLSGHWNWAASAVQYQATVPPVSIAPGWTSAISSISSSRLSRLRITAPPSGPASVSFAVIVFGQDADEMIVEQHIVGVRSA